MKQYVFWKYDLYPFVLWAEVDKIEDGKIHAGIFVFDFNRIITLLGEKEGKNLITDLTSMKENYRNTIDDFNKKARLLIERISK